MVARRAFERLYDGICIIEEQRSLSDQNTGRIRMSQVTSEPMPCRLSYKSTPSANEDGGINSLSQSVTLFINPDVVIKGGSDITVTHRNRTLHFKSSGVPMVYVTHQEVPLELRTVHNG